MTNMKTLIQAFPSNIADALAMVKNAHFENISKDVTNVVVCGMGGSGIGGSLVWSWIQNEMEIPVSFVQDYTLPKFVNENSLVIASSYSGNTEETVACLNEALNRNSKLYVVCSGGKLEELSKSKGIMHSIVPGGNPPRTALAYSMIHLLGLFESQGFISGDWKLDMLDSKQLLEDNESLIKEEALVLAKFLKDKVGVFYGATVLDPVLVRARQQFNENSKLLCWHHTIPEMNHNELVGWGGGDDRFATVFFHIDGMNPRNVRRFEITKDKVQSHNAAVLDVKAKGTSLMAQTLYLINLIDWSSLYLSDLNEVDPIEIDIINYLKNEMANF